MKVYQIKLKVFMLKNVLINEIQSVISEFIDTALSKDEILSNFHKDNKYKQYSFDGFYPLEKEKIYKKKP